MSKYEPLENHLRKKGMSQIPMTFREIESVIADRLPPSARKHRAWWSNNPTNSVITYSWLAAGYKTADVNLEGERVVFVKSDKCNLDHARASGAVPANSSEQHPVFNCVKNTVTISDDVDLTEPAAPEWRDAARAPRLLNE